MITEDYCSYEVAKLLKEKGFDEPCRAIYEEKVLRINTLCDYCNSELSSYVCATTHQMAMKWLREEKNIIVNVWYNGADWNAEYYNDEVDNFYLITDCLCNSYEECVESALKYVLENLI